MMRSSGKGFGGGGKKRFAPGNTGAARPNKKAKKFAKEKDEGEEKEEGEEGWTSEFPSMKDEMEPIEYVESANDNYKWEQVTIDPRLFGQNADMFGLMSICKLSDAENAKFMKKYEDTKRNIKVGSASQAEQGAEDQEVKKKKKKKKKKALPTPAMPEDPIEDDNEEAGDAADDAEVDGEGMAADDVLEESEEVPAKSKKKKSSKKKEGTKEKKEKALGKNALEGGEEESNENGDEATEEAVVAPQEADDDEWEYDEWGGIMLRKCIVRAIADLGFDQPTPIQTAVLPVALSKRCDIFGAAETGSGKTLAFAIPMLQRVLESHSFSGIEARDRRLAGLVLSPTRELAIQVRDHMLAAAKYTKIRVVGIVGGLSIEKQNRLLTGRPHIVVGTPGRLWEVMQHGDGYLTDLKMLLCLVIDEADRMLEVGHFQELENILGLLPKLDPKRTRPTETEEGQSDDEMFPGADEKEEIDTFASKAGQGSGTEQRHYRRQTMVFSATLIKDTVWRKDKNTKQKKGKPGSQMKKADDQKSKEEIREESIAKIVGKLDLVGEPTIIDVTPTGKVSQKIAQYRINTLPVEKDVHVYHILLKHLSAGGGRSLVFANAIGEARRLAAILNLLRVRAVLLHSSLQQRQRLKNLDVFKGDRNCVMIATDLASRGLDMPNIELVIHYHVPKVPSVYVHRCGRSGRGKAEGGRSVLLAAPAETKSYQKIVDVIGEDLPEMHDEGPHFAAAERRVVAAKKLEQELNKASKAARHATWVRTQAEAMEMALESEESGEDELLTAEVTVKEDRKVQQMRANLEKMLDSSILPSGTSPRFVTTDGCLPEMLSHGATSGSLHRFADGARVHRKKSGKPRKFGRR